MQTERIFLTSSEELRADRIAFELMISQLNQDWVPWGTSFHLIDRGKIQATSRLA